VTTSFASLEGRGTVVHGNRPSDSEVADKVDIFRDCVLISGFTMTLFGKALLVPRSAGILQVISRNVKQSGRSGQCSVLWNTSMCSTSPRSDRNRRVMPSCSGRCDLWKNHSRAKPANLYPIPQDAPIRR